MGIGLPGFRRPDEDMRFTPASVNEPFPATRAEMRYQWQRGTEEPEQAGLSEAYRNFREKLRAFSEAPGQMTPGPFGMITPLPGADALQDMREKTRLGRQAGLAGLNVATGGLWGTMKQADLAGLDIGAVPRTIEGALRAGFAVGEKIPEEVKGRFTGTARAYRDLAEEYGESRELYDAVYRTGSMAWSGYNRQRRAAERMLHGESYGTAVHGDYDAADPVRSVAMKAGAIQDSDTGRWTIPDESLPQVVNAIQQTPDVAEYFGYQTEVQGEDPLDVAERVLNEGVPGEENIVAELAGNIILDLWNIPGLVRGGGKLLGKAGLVERRFFDDAVQAGAKLHPAHPEDVYKATAEAKGFWNLLESIPETKQSKIIQVTRDVLKNAVVQLDTPQDQIKVMDAYAKLAGSEDEVADAIQTLNKLGVGRWEVDDVNDAREFGVQVGEIVSPLESEAGKLGSYLWRNMLSTDAGNYQPERLQETVKAAETGEQAVRALLDDMVSTAEKLYPQEDPTPLLKANRAVKGFIAKFLHMGFSPGYAFRNAIQNTVQGIVDGVHPFIRGGVLDDFFEDFGYKPAAALRGLGTGGPGGELLHERAVAQKALKGERMQTFGDVIKGGPALWLSGRFEEAAGVRAVYHGIKNVMRRHFRPGMLIPTDKIDELAAVVGDDVAQAVVSDMMHKYNPRQWDEILDYVTGEAGVVELWRKLDPQTAGKLDELGLLDEVDELLSKAGSEDEFIKGIDVLIDQAFAKGDEFAETTAVPDGTEVARVMERLDQSVESAGGWEELPPLTEEGFEEGKRILAGVRRRLQGARGRALYYSAQSGDEDLLRELVAAIGDTDAGHARMHRQLAMLREELMPLYTRARQAGRHEEANDIWRSYSARQFELATDHFQEVVDRFADIAQRGKEMEASDRMDELVRVLNEEILEAPTVERLDLDTLIETATEQMGYGRGDVAGGRPHLANTLAQEFDEVTGATVEEKLESFADALEQGKLDADEVWETLWRHQTQYPERIPGAEEITEALEVQMPAHADDYARTLGFEPEQMEAEDWDEVARYAQEEYQRRLQEGTAAGRRAMAEREAGRQPEVGQAFGEEQIQYKGAYSFSWIQDKIDELADASKEEGTKVVDWALQEAGFTPDELEGLSTSEMWRRRHKSRLLAEIAKGDLLTTESGKVSKIDDIPVERRQELIDAVSEGLQEDAFKVLSDPEAHVAYWYGEVAEEARLKAQAMEAGAQLPVRGVGQYTPTGFPTTEEGVELGGIVERRIELPERPTAPEFYREQPEIPSLWRRLGELVDDGHMPTPQEMADNMAPQIEAELLNARDRVISEWGNTTGRVENVEAVEEFLDFMRPRVNALRSVAAKVGESARDFAYHNYGDRRRIDSLAGFVWMYPFWYSRTYTKWAKRAMDQPHLISAYFNLQDYLHEVNEDLPEWWHDQIKVADVLGEEVYVPIQGLVNPLYGMVDHFRTDERARVKMFGQPVGQVVQELGAWGPSTHNLLGYALALSAWMNGDKEAALSWAGFQSQWSKALVGATAGARELGVKAIPPGGMGVTEPWMYEPVEGGVRFQGSIYDRRRIGYILADMVRQGAIDTGEADLAAYFGSGPTHDEALQKHALSRMMPNLIAWGLGTGLKPRRDYEVEITRMWDMVNNLHEAREAGTLTGDEYSEAWRELKRRYPYFNTIMMTRMGDDAKDESLTWSVINRLPPGWRRTETFEDEDVGQLIRKFYESSGDMSDWSEDERRKLMAGVIKLARETETPTARQQAEWDEARRRYKALEGMAVEEFGEEIIELQDEYWSLPKEDRKAFVDKHPELEEYWDWTDEQKEGDPLLDKYYVRPPEFWTQSEAQSAFFDSYFTSVPPGTAEWALKDDLPLLNAMRDYDVRGWLQEQGWTVEQYKAAIAQVEDWIKNNPDQIIGDPQEWEQARQLNNVYWDRREVLFPNYSDLIDQYMDLEGDAKTQFKREHPELAAFWDWRSQFAQTHQLWAKYYRPEEYEGERLVDGKPEGSSEGTSARGRSGGRRYYGGGGGGGGGVSIRSWEDFMLNANPQAIRELLRGQPGGALKELHSQIGWGSLERWAAFLLQLYRRQFKGTTRTPSVQYPHWLPGTLRD
jgi:hypothetical protein